MKKGKKDFLKEMQYIDGITIIDTDRTILFSVKFNPWFHPEIINGEKVIGKKLCDIFTNINKETSTLVKAMELGKPVTRKRQSVVDVEGNMIVTMNTSLPIKGDDKIVGAIELSRDITKRKDENIHAIEMNKDIFSNMIDINNLQGENKAKYNIEDIISNNIKMKELKYFVKKIANGKGSVFIYGETGTGKELFAHAIHNASNRANKPFIAQNCAAIPENLLESILFGTIKGSFTGAYDNPGLFEMAEGGTVFLDEINSMPIILQSKLLRVLQDGYVRRLGDFKERKIDVRVISAANISPKKCIKLGKLREDIYYRLAVFSIHIPPLRERKEDIQILLNFFINRYNKILSKNVKTVSKEAYNALTDYDWKGNIRELEHVVEYAMNIIDETEEEIGIESIENCIEDSLEDNDYSEDVDIKIDSLKDAVSKLEKKMILRAIKKTNGNVSKAARLLDIPRQTLQKKITKYKI